MYIHIRFEEKNSKYIQFLKINANFCQVNSPPIGQNSSCPFQLQILKTSCLVNTVALKGDPSFLTILLVSSACFLFPVNQGFPLPVNETDAFSIHFQLLNDAQKNKQNLTTFHFSGISVQNILVALSLKGQGDVLNINVTDSFKSHIGDSPEIF